MCHQTVSLVANVVEAAGIVSVIAGSARDIVEEVGAPRFYFTDFPLGNPLGRPDDFAEQQRLLAGALELAVNAWAPRTTVQADAVWGDTGWRARFMAIDDPDALAKAGEARRAKQQETKSSEAPG